jgi:hypothetical protein
MQFVQGNLIYLAMLTERVPIVGPFTPSHIGGDAGEILFSEVFDIDYLSETIRLPVLQWSEVKNSSSTEVEDIGCWSVWQAVQTRESRPRITSALSLQGLGEQTHVSINDSRLMKHHGQTSLSPLALSHFKKSLGMSMTYMRTFGA